VGTIQLKGKSSLFEQVHLLQDPIFAKTPENPPHCHVPLISHLSEEEIIPKCQANFEGFLHFHDFFTIQFVELHRNIHLERLSLQKSSVFHGV
jgi:hypothetical protein